MRSTRAVLHAGMQSGRSHAPYNKGGWGAMGAQSARGLDEMPLYNKKSPEHATANFFARLQRQGPAMDGRRGWGSRKTRLEEAGAHTSTGDYRRVTTGDVEDLQDESWRVNVEQDVNEVAGTEGLRQWKQENESEIRRMQKPKRFQNNYERDDIEAYEQWLIPLKRKRLENTFKVKETRFRKTPEFDMTPFQQRVIRKMWTGIEGCLVDHPLPFRGSRENFCVTHIECVQWQSLEQYMVCWKLVLNESERADYETILRGKVCDVWAKDIHKRMRIGHLKPVLWFVYDDGTIPYRRSVIEQNIMRSKKGLAPIPMHGKNNAIWGMSTANFDHGKKTLDPDQAADPVRDFLLEARASLSTCN